MKHATVSVAAIQMTVTTLDVNANLRCAEQLLAEALKRGPLDLVVFPEDCITGPIPDRDDYLLAEDSQPVTFYRELARTHRLHLVAGSFICRQGGKLYNRSLLIGPDGDTLLRYDKNNLWHPERPYLTPGKDLPVAKTVLGNIGIMNCWDLTDPSIAGTLAKKGADIICCPSYWMDEVSGGLYDKYPGKEPDATLIDALCKARAMETNTLLIYANVSGQSEIFLPDRTLHLQPVGHSQITAPIYGVLGSLPNGQDGVVRATYNHNVSADGEAAYGFVGDMKGWRYAR